MKRIIIIITAAIVGGAIAAGIGYVFNFYRFNYLTQLDCVVSNILLAFAIGILAMLTAGMFNKKAESESGFLLTCIVSMLGISLISGMCYFHLPGLLNWVIWNGVIGSLHSGIASLIATAAYPKSN